MQPLLLIQAGSEGLQDLSSRSRNIPSSTDRINKVNGHTYYNLAGDTLIKLNPDARMHSKKWTIDAWIYMPATHDNYSYLFTLSNGINYTNGLVFGIRETRAVLAQYGTGFGETVINTAGDALPSLARSLVTITYNDGTLKLYFNGVLYGTTTGAIADYTNVQPYFGYDPRNPNRNSKVYVDQLIFWDGVRYTDSFTPEYVHYEQKDFATNQLPPNGAVVPADYNGVIADKVLIKGIPTERKVCLYRRGTNELVATTWSNKLGDYEFRNLRPNTEYYVLSLDHERGYNAVIQDMLRTEK